MSARICGLNRRILKGSRAEGRGLIICNCREEEKCPMGGREGCNVGSVVYKAVVSSKGEADGFYLGSSRDCKGWRARHSQSLRDREMAKDTGLAEEVWRRRELGQKPKVLFNVVRGAAPYTPEVGRCALCRA